MEDPPKRGKPHVKVVESHVKRRITHSKMHTLGFVPFLMKQLCSWPANLVMVTMALLCHEVHHPCVQCGVVDDTFVKNALQPEDGWDGMLAQTAVAETIDMLLMVGHLTNLGHYVVFEVDKGHREVTIASMRCLHTEGHACGTNGRITFTPLSAGIGWPR